MAREKAVSRGASPRPVLPWWAGGLALAGVLLAAVALVKPLGVSTQYVRAIGGVCSLVDPGIGESNAYFRTESLRFGYEEMVVIGILPGAFLAALLTGRLRPGRGAGDLPGARGGRSRSGRILAALGGGALLLFGARLAGGCTSGHILSGVSQLALSSILFAVAAFGSAVLAARILPGPAASAGGAR